MAAGQRLVAYERVSTERQGASGLGLKAQRKVVEDFAVSHGAEVLGRFSEVESGRKADRPELVKELHLAKVTGSTLVIAKLDRLSRNAAFLLALRDSGVRFVDMPEPNDVTVSMMALVAQAEREATSRRMKEALAVAKARGQPERCREPQKGGQGRCGAASFSVGQCGGICGGPCVGPRRHPG
jgi:DNA invertase Pin-like site-specific DNA recombinase